MNVTIIGKEYDNQILQLFNDVFGLKKDHLFWEEKHYGNPFGDTIFVGIFDGERLIAVNGFVPLEYSYRGETYRALQSCESAVHKEYRHRGLFSKLILYMEDWAKENEIDFLFGCPNDKSYGGFIKIGWKEVADRHRYARIVSIKEQLRRLRVTNFRPLTDGLLLLNSFKQLVSDWLISRKYIVTVVDENSYISERIINDTYMECRYTDEFLKWKLDSNGRIYRVSYEDKTILHALIRGDYIAALSYKNEEKCVPAALRALLVNSMRKASLVDVIVNDTDIKLVKKAGFISKREARYPIIVKTISDRAKEVEINEIYWNIQGIEGA